MGVHRVRVNELQDEMLLGAQEVRHLHVLRMQVGQMVQVFDGRGQQVAARIVELDAQRARLSLCGEIQNAATETPQPITLAIALLKGDKLADVVRAATELGVARVQLLQTQYADVPDIGQQKLLRLRRIAAEASRQSRRAVTPEVLEPLPLSQLNPAGQVFVAHPEVGATLLTALTWNTPVTLVSGPEGGFSEAELSPLIERGATLISLGPRILRAETAPLALLGAIAASGV